MNDLIQYEYRISDVTGLREDVRVEVRDGEPWFVAADVCSILDIKDVSDAVSRVDQADRDQTPVRSGSQHRRMWIVNESGLYDLVLRSDKPEARPFRRWITSKVLPTLRKTGRYEVAASLALPKSYAEALRELAATVEERDTAQAKVIEQAPMVAAEEHHRSAHGLKAVGDFANDLKAWAKTNHPGVKVKHQDVWAHLARLGMVIRGDTVRHNQPTAKAVEQGWCVPKVSDYDTSEGARSSTTTRLTPKGEGYAWDRITAFVEANGTLELPRRIGPVAS